MACRSKTPNLPSLTLCSRPRMKSTYSVGCAIRSAQFANMIPQRPGDFHTICELAITKAGRLLQVHQVPSLPQESTKAYRWRTWPSRAHWRHRLQDVGRLRGGGELHLAQCQRLQRGRQRDVRSRRAIGGESTPEPPTSTLLLIPYRYTSNRCWSELSQRSADPRNRRLRSVLPSHPRSP